MIGDQLVGEVPPTGLWYPKPFAILAKDRARAVPLSTEARNLKRIVEKRAATAAGNNDQKIKSRLSSMHPLPRSKLVQHPRISKNDLAMASSAR